MILYSNLSSVTVNKKKMKCVAVLKITSSKLQGSLTSADKKTDISAYFKKNKFTISQTKLIEDVFKEANHNNFVVKLMYSK